MSEKLLPCPFCGGEASFWSKGAEIDHKDDCVFTRGHVLIPEEYEQWNTRATLDAKDVPSIEEIEKCLDDVNKLDTDDNSESAMAVHRLLTGKKNEFKEPLESNDV